MGASGLWLFRNVVVFVADVDDDLIAVREFKWFRIVCAWLLFVRLVDVDMIGLVVMLNIFVSNSLATVSAADAFVTAVDGIVPIVAFTEAAVDVFNVGIPIAVEFSFIW